MTDGYIALIVVGSILVYTTGCGVTYAIGKHRRWNYDYPGPCFGLVFWPAALPALLAAHITERLLAPKLPKATAREMRNP